MRFVFHPEFAKDVRRFAQQYGQISSRLERRFRSEVDASLVLIKSAPTSAGHFLKSDSTAIDDVRRTNLSVFPFFILYGLHSDLIVIGALIPVASDPLTWLDRFLGS